MLSIAQGIVVVEKILMLLICFGQYLYFRQKKMSSHNALLSALVFLSLVVNLLNPQNGFVYNLVYSVTSTIKMYILMSTGCMLWKQRVADEDRTTTIRLIDVAMGLGLILIWAFIVNLFLRPEVSVDYSKYLREYMNGAGKFYVLLKSFVIGPISEELYYRCYYMNQIAYWTRKYKYSMVISIALTAVSFAISHVGIYTNDMVKIVQILPLGIILGCISYKKGVAYSIPIHILYNIALILII